MSNKIKVLVVDDSAVVRKILSTSLNKHMDIEVVGTAPDPFVARDKILSLKPDVLTLDVEMPRMDGLTFLKKLMDYYPIPTVMVSSLTQEGCDVTLQALEVGAIDYVAKPTGRLSSDVKDILEELYLKIKIASKAKLRRRVDVEKQILNRSPIQTLYPKSNFQEQPNRADEINYTVFKGSNRIIAIGASTGGTEALKEVLIQMPHDSPSIVVVQHMPELFTRQFSARLDSLCAISVKEGKNGDSLTPGHAIIAPGNYHVRLRRSGAMYHIETNQEAPVHHQRPAVDVLFDSVAKYAGPNAIGVIMTGMGSDGASGLLKMKESGAKTIAQDEDTCVVFGMPKEAIKVGAVDKVVPLQKIPESIVAFLRS